MSPLDQPLASLSLTHVHYVRIPLAWMYAFGVVACLLTDGRQNPRDIFSYLSAWLALIPQALCVVYVTLIWASREVEVMLMFAGQLGCETLNFALKRWIREERPKREFHSGTVLTSLTPIHRHANEEIPPEMFGKGYGMPSSHSQFVAFFSVYFALFLLLRHAPQPSTRNATTFLERVALSILACIGAGAVAISRVYLNYHTPKQVLAGYAAGVMFAIVWFSFTSYLRRYGWIDWCLDLPLARKARIRDLLLSEDLVEAGWQRWDAQRKLKRQEDASRKSI
jgi:dolichyldiphosphatase